MKLVYSRLVFDQHGNMIEKENKNMRVEKAPVLPAEVRLVGENTWQHVAYGLLNETVRSWRLMEA